MGKSLGWWDYQATWLLNLTKKLQAIRVAKIPQPPAQPQTREIPLTFLEVDPSLAIPEPPKDAKFYGAQNSAAANPKVQDKPDPKLDGKQNKIVRAEDVPKPFPLQPAVAPPKPEETAQSKPKEEAPGDMVKLENPGKVSQPKPVQHEKPRTLAEARAQKNMLAGEKAQLDGGARRPGRIGFDVKATSFGSYDAAFIAAVQDRWYNLLESSRFAQKSGKVVLEFRLMYDGRITDMKMSDNDVGELLGLLCERAVLDPAPFAPWPSDMRREIGHNFREVTFTFFYN